MKNFINPVVRFEGDEYGRTADPYIVCHNNKYYHCYMKLGGVYIVEADELGDLGTVKETLVYPDNPQVHEWYAPELHRIGDSWYIYGAPTVDGGEVHCMTVLELKGDSPVGEYTFKGMMKGLENRWSIDGTILHHDNKMYFVWTDCGHLYISEMDGPLAIKGETTTLAIPELDFELREGRIIEGPAILERGNKIHIVYSTNNSKSDEYCLGVLTCCGGDVLDAKSWVKNPKPLLEKTDEIFGPGHCAFFKAEKDGVMTDFITYHANLVSGSGWFGRNLWIQSFTWDENDMPVFGRPRWNPFED